MKQVDTFVIIRRFRQQKKETNIKLKELVKRVVLKEQIEGWSNEPPSLIKKKKFITKISKASLTSIKENKSDQDYSQDQNAQRIQEFINPFVDDFDDKGLKDGSLKLDYQQSIMTQDQMLGVDDYFTF